MILKLLGVLGSIAFSMCGIPAAIKTFRAKKSIGTPISACLLVLIGSLLTLPYILLTYGLDLVLVPGYLLQITAWTVIAYYHFFPKTSTLPTSKSTLGRKYDRKPDKLAGSEVYYDKTIEPLNGPLPPKIDLRPLCPPVYDQGQIGSCSSHAAAAAFEFLQLKELREVSNGAELLEPKSYDPASRLFIYYNERRFENTTREDSGATLKDAIKSMLYYGVCQESSWPYIESQIFSEPPETAYEEALKHRISKYYRFDDLDHIKHSLAAGYPVIFGISVFESLESDEVAETGMVPMPKPNERYLGGHAILACGYDDEKQVIIVRNSWGLGWGQLGYFYLPYGYIQNPQLASDFWTIRR